MEKKINLISPVEDLVFRSDDSMAVQSIQEIPNEFIDDNRAAYDASMNAPIGNWMHVARIPAAVINHWFREGFNVFESGVTAAEIQARLKHANLEFFLRTKKQA